MSDANYIVSSEFDGQKRKLFPKICDPCGKTFYIPQHRLQQPSCSRKCTVLRRRKGTIVEVICSQCGKSFERTRGRIRSKHGQFCSKLCKDIGQSLRGNCPEIRPSHYGTAKVPNYRTLVDITHCALCRCDEVYLLVVHHIDGNRENNDLDNLRILCFNCHGRHHLYEANGEWRYSTSALTPLSKLKEFGDVV